MKLARLSRRKFFLMALLAAPSLAVADALQFEPGSIRTRKIRVGDSKPTHRFIHFTDLHHRGDRALCKCPVQLPAGDHRVRNVNECA
jgi:hypothetical protein